MSTVNTGVWVVDKLEKGSKSKIDNLPLRPDASDCSVCSLHVVYMWFPEIANKLLLLYRPCVFGGHGQTCELYSTS